MPSIGKNLGGSWYEQKNLDGNGGVIPLCYSCGLWRRR